MRRLLLAAGLITLLGSWPARAIAVQSDSVVPGESTVRWAVQIGGPMFLLVLVLLWFIRREFERAKEESRELRTVVIDNTRAMTTVTTTNQEVVRALRSVERHFDQAHQSQHPRRP